MDRNPTIAELLAAAEPADPRPLGELIARLVADRRLHGARDGGKAIGPAALASIPIRGVTDDSRAVRPGALFVAIPGLHVDGHAFVAAAASSSAMVACDPVASGGIVISRPQPRRSRRDAFEARRPIR